MRFGLLAPFSIVLFFALAAASPAADFDGDSREDVAVYRPSNGQWTIRGFTRIYFGTSADTPFAGDFDGDGIADPAYHRPSNGLWKAKGITQFYFGNAGSGDERVAAGTGGQRLYDYVVKAGDGNDLKAALESDVYDSVFVPAGYYGVANDIVIDHVTQVTGESMEKTIISFARQYTVELYITSQGCHLEKLQIVNGGGVSPVNGSVNIQSAYVTLQECLSLDSKGVGFLYTSDADYVSFIDCIADDAEHSGFSGPSEGEVSARFTNCAARLVTYNGFLYCNNLSSCYVWGGSETSYGFRYCSNLAACHSEGCTTSDYGSCSLRCTESCD